MHLDALTAFGLFAVTFTLICYAFEKRSHWFTLGFAGGCVLSSVYGFLQGAWPFGVMEVVWTIVALHRWGRQNKTVRRLTFTSTCPVSRGGLRHRETPGGHPP